MSFSKSVSSLFHDRLHLAGLAFIGVSLFIFEMPGFHSFEMNDDMGMFTLNFLITVTYFVILLLTRRLKRGREGIFPLFLFLILFLISAYSLNRSMTVFETSTPWFSTLEAVLCAGYVLLVWFEQMDGWARHLLCFLTGVGSIVFLYLAVYLFPLYGVSALASVFLGISAHTFVPLLFVIYTLAWMRRAGSRNRMHWLSFGAGSLTALLIVIVFVVRWGITTSEINKTWRQADLINERGYPAWVAVAQKAPQGRITEKILKTEIVYSAPATQFSDWFWSMPTRNFGEAKRHDPLIMIAIFFGGRVSIPEDDRIKILEAMYDSRHQAQERLWRADDLYTEEVKTKVRIWPELHLSYTEKSLTVTSKQIPTRSRWWDQQEAIYTFHLPEGAIVSSLSLWIDGKEAKGVLSSKEKADSAYKRIVGVEQHDPSVVHWQEGNTVSVRVFPIVAGKSRLFTIGITAPLEKKQDRLIYRNIYFDGPSGQTATEDIHIDLEKRPEGLKLPTLLQPMGEKSFTGFGRYNPDWALAFRDEEPKENAFYFDGQQYAIEPYLVQREEKDFQKIYLDVNSAWTREEFEKIWDLVKDKKVHVFTNTRGMTTLTARNKEELFKELSRYRFSLFPIYRMEDPGSALLITKNSDASPAIGDLTNSAFKQDLEEYLSKGQKICLFDAGARLSPYLKALKEYRAFRYEQGDPARLQELLTTHRFARDIENDEQVVIDNAGILIKKTALANTLPVVNGTAVTGTAAATVINGTAGSTPVTPGTGVALPAVNHGTAGTAATAGTLAAPPSTAPDHLMRLFAYNHIMQKTGMRLLSDTSVNEEMVKEAQKAYVVSPVSSLIVLETQKDYDRFNIKDNPNSLQNATMKSKGAVPEPQEWALIIMALLAVIYAQYSWVRKTGKNIGI